MRSKNRVAFLMAFHSCRGTLQNRRFSGYREQRAEEALSLFDGTTETKRFRQAKNFINIRRRRFVFRRIGTVQ